MLGDFLFKDKDVVRKVVTHVKDYDSIRNRTVRELFSIDDQAASALLKKLCARGILVITSKYGVGRGVRYGPGRKFPK